MANYNTDTKTKFILSDRKGAPPLPPVWGSLNALLKVVLTEGFNPQIISTMTIDLSSRLVTAKLPLGHGYIRNDVIAISGATQQEFNREFRVVDFKADEINFVAPEGTNISEVTTTSTLNCKIAPLGYSIAYENATEGVICFKNTSVQSPAILKVIDKVPPNGYTTTWAKFARVVAGQEIDSKGDFVDNKKTPYNPDYPDMEKTGNKVSGSTGIHGLAKWDYGFLYNSNGYHREYEAVNWTEPTDWKVIGDSQTFYIMIKNEGKTEHYCLYGFGNFISEDFYDTTNIVLQARHGNYAANSHGSAYNGPRSQNQFLILNYSYGNYIFSSVYGNVPYITATNLTGSAYYCTGLYLGSIKPWASTAIVSIHPTTGKLITSEVGIKDADGIVRGKHRGVRIVYGTSGLSEGLETDNFDIVTIVKDAATGHTSSTSTMPVIFSLKDWEEVP